MKVKMVAFPKKRITFKEIQAYLATLPEVERRKKIKEINKAVYMLQEPKRLKKLWGLKFDKKEK